MCVKYRFPLIEIIRVPQIWLTYDELAVLLECDTLSARDAAMSLRLDRRRSRDGHTRAKLTPPLTETFLNAVVRHRVSQEIATCADDLRVMRERMATHDVAQPLRRRIIAG